MRDEILWTTLGASCHPSDICQHNRVLFSTTSVTRHIKVFNAYLGIFWGHQVLCYLLTQLLKHRLKASVEVDLRPRVSRGKVLQKVPIYWQKKEKGRTLPWDQAQVDLFQDIFALRDVAHCRPPPRRHGTIALWQIFIFWDPMTPLYKSKDTLATNLVTPPQGLSPLKSQDTLATNLHPLWSTIFSFVDCPNSQLTCAILLITGKNQSSGEVRKTQWFL